MNLDKKQFTTNINKNSAYLLGFIWADGYIPNTNPKEHSINLEIITTDMNDIKYILESTGEWSFYNRVRPLRKPITKAYTSDIDVYNLLIKMDYTDKSYKAPTKILQHIPKELHQYWWHGYFDGDGCIYHHKTKNNAQLSFASGYSQDWSFVEDIFKNFGLSYKFRRTSSKLGHKYSMIRCSKPEEITNFMIYMYEDKEFVGLKRKYEKVLDYLNFHHNRLVNRLIPLITQRDIIARYISN
jgi:DNA-binding transcriptional regulator WhiA